MEGEMKRKGGEPKYGSVSIPMGILEEIDYLIERLRYWPSRSAFIREACLEKIRRERERLREVERRRRESSPGD
ncbi:hypothetical protein DRO56_02370 [Candidatus Bathyarchaeota archaeon]|nr:MAG: hypothetical protein DRO56_02370 [Candidatus Bathyarchaeota archaeon]